MDIDTAKTLDKIGHGMRLAIARDGSGARLIPDRRFSPDADEQLLSAEVAESLLQGGLLHELTEHGEPPASERKPNEGYRAGWRETGLPGEQYRIFVMTQ